MQVVSSLRTGLAWGLILATVAPVSLSLSSAQAIAQVFTDPVKPPVAKRFPPPPTTGRAKARSPKRAAEAPSRASKVMVQNFTDPMPYCAANPNGVAGPNYIGPAAPDWVLHAADLTGPRQARPSGTAPVAWRCRDGKVLVCRDSAEVVCGRPSQDTMPSAVVREYCAANRNLPVPKAVAGNTLAVWQCREGNPTITGYFSGLDAQGYFSSAWHDASVFAPGRAVGAVPGYFLGEWQGAIRGKGHFLKVTYAVALTLVGGQLGSNAGVVGYYGVNLGGNTFEACASNIVLRSFAEGRFLADERLERKGPPAFKCPAQAAMTMQLREGQMWVEWLDAKGKIKMSGALQRSR